MERASLVIRSIWAACLLVAAANHARTLLRHGLFWDYGGVGWGSAFYWSSLTLIDPIVAALLFVRPKAGIVATILHIVTNVIHNLTVTAVHAAPGDFLLSVASRPFLLTQIGFMIFVGATARIGWRGVGSGGEPREQS